MFQNAGSVYNIAKENKPIEHATITNVIYEGINYRYTCYSMGAGTSFMPERHQFIGLIVVDEGELIVQAKDGDNWHVTTVPQGYVFLRPAYQLIGFKAEKNTVFVEFDFPVSSKIAEELFPEKPFNMLDLVTYNRQNGRSRTVILSGDVFEVDVISYVSGFIRPEKRWASGMVHVYAGKLEVTRENNKIVMCPGDNLIAKAEDEVVLKALEDTVLATFYRK